MARRMVLLGVAVLVLAVPSCQPHEGKPRRGASVARQQPAEVRWSKAVNRLQARLELRYRHAFNGTPVLATYLYLRNVESHVGDVKLAWEAQQMKFRVVDAKGKEIPTGFNGSMAYSGPGMPGPFTLLIPFGGMLSFDVSGHGMGIAGDQVAAIDLGPKYCWVLSKSDGPCSLQVVLEIPEHEEDKRITWSERPWFGRIELPPVPIPTEIPQPSPAGAGRRGGDDRSGAGLVLDDHPGIGGLPSGAVTLDDAGAWIELMLLVRFGSDKPLHFSQSLWRLYSVICCSAEACT